MVPVDAVVVAVGDAVAATGSASRRAAVADGDVFLQVVVVRERQHDPAEAVVVRRDLLDAGFLALEHEDAVAAEGLHHARPADLDVIESRGRNAIEGERTRITGTERRARRAPTRRSGGAAHGEAIEPERDVALAELNAWPRRVRADDVAAQPGVLGDHECGRDDAADAVREREVAIARAAVRAESG